MSKDKEVRELRRKRDQELASLHARIGTLAEALQKEPAQWVGQHPYMATGGAALLGFLAAQIAFRPRSPASAPAPEAGPATSPAPAATTAAGAVGNALSRADLLGLLMDLAVQYLHPPAGAGVISPAIGDAGSLAGPAFPGIIEPQTPP